VRDLASTEHAEGERSCHEGNGSFRRCTESLSSSGQHHRLLIAELSTLVWALAPIISLETTLPTMQGNGSNIPQQTKPPTLSIKTTIDAEYLLLSDASSWPVDRRAVWPPKYIAFVDEEREPNDVSDRPVHRRSRPRLPKSPPPSAKKAAVAVSVSPPSAGEVRDTMFIFSVEACTCGYEDAPRAASSVESNEELIGLSFLDAEQDEKGIVIELLYPLGPDREIENATTSEVGPLDL